MSRVLLAAFVSIVPGSAYAHAVVYPRRAVTGAYEKYELRVPNERAVPTIRVEIRFPPGLRVVSFGDVPGWRLRVVTDSARAIVGAIWTGNLPVERFVEFPFVAVNPRTPATLVWPAYQTYADGERVEWTGPEGAKTPASVSTISPGSIPPAEVPSVVASPAVPAPAVAPPPVNGLATASLWLAAVALVLSLLSLGFSIRRPSERG